MSITPRSELHSQLCHRVPKSHDELRRMTTRESPRRTQTPTVVLQEIVQQHRGRDNHRKTIDPRGKVNGVKAKVSAARARGLCKVKEVKAKEEPGRGSSEALVIRVQDNRVQDNRVQDNAAPTNEDKDAIDTSDETKARIRTTARRIGRDPSLLNLRHQLLMRCKMDASHSDRFRI